MTRRQLWELLLMLAAPLLAGVIISAVIEQRTWEAFAVPCLYAILAQLVIMRMGSTDDEGSAE